ncbi:FAD-dependent monooxygenase [Couchioplanes caeruleus]|uniref:FAD-dependent oxidoreductase n=2 Tax=Couchioplanes caeruleus TaxID=56438 RepID=A0A1K0FCP5_9ACTN|nr:FAD-dependent monooxygenase [Couchioplanes caeruleus]OJF10520.1 FAD-dependent oxidoreductase [Couchioplanes caeruleus subsp. caeruleus]ROP28612.1 2-polyprenyl-6-methoxyphenol hydroxylase-like FAD-dependent oxidoreductase [Couchioplanes caeruleus]
MTRTAVVVGAGIGGLGAAVGLRRKGWQVTVLDRVPAFRPVGAGLVLQANGLRCLAALGLGAAVRERGLPDMSAGTRRSDGRWLTRVRAGDLAHMLGTSAVGIHRAALHEILLGALPEGTVVTGADVEAVTEDGDVTWRGPDGLVRVRADLVVAADGIHSPVRRRLWPEAAGPVRIGVTAWRGVTRIPDDDLVVGITWDRGAEFGMVPLIDGRVYWYGAVNAAAEAAAAEPGDEAGRVRARFGSWHDPIPALIAATGTVLRDDLACLDEPLATYVKGRVALVGDAAHAMTPHLGQGANQALEDAVVLAAVADRPGGLAEYDRQRRPRSQQVARASRAIGRFGQQAHHPVAAAVRNAILRLTPPRLALRSMARFADWQPPSLE